MANPGAVAFFFCGKIHGKNGTVEMRRFLVKLHKKDFLICFVC